jgi:hypothetical protein
MILFFSLLRVFDPLAGAMSIPIPIPAATPAIAARIIFEPEFAIEQ